MFDLVKLLPFGCVYTLSLALLFSRIAGAAESMPEPKDYQVKFIGPNEGFPANSITEIARTPEGYLWAGTLFSGLVRYDGVRFVSFNPKTTPGLLNYATRHVMTDSSGLLWIANYDGSLTTWDSSGFSFAAKTEGLVESLLWSKPGHIIFSLNNGHIWEGTRASHAQRWSFSETAGMKGKAISADHSGRVWVLMSKTEIGFYEQGHYQKIALPSGLGRESMLTLGADSHGSIWIGTDHSLFHWEGDRLVDRTPRGEEEQQPILGITASGESLWIETDAGLRRYKNGKWMTKIIAWNPNPPSGRLRLCQGDSKDGFWATHQKLGLIHIREDGECRIFSTADGLPSTSVTSLFIDKDENTWLGYFRGGMVQIHPRLIHNIGRGEGLGDVIVNTVCEDSQGALWIGTSGTNVLRFKDGQSTDYPMPSMVREPSTMVIVDGSNRVWACTQGGGLMRFDDGAFVTVIKPGDLPRFVSLMLPTRDGRLWLGANQSIGFVEGDKFKEIFITEESIRHPAALAETSDGTVWAGTYDGFLMRWTGLIFETVEPPNCKTLGRIWAMCPSPDGGLWIGTSQGGLLRWKAGKFSQLTTANGLSSDSVVQVQLDLSGDLWLNTGAGLEKINAASLAQFESGKLPAVPAIQYGRGDGLQNLGGSIEFQPNSWRSKNGCLLFASGISVTSIQPEEARVVPPPPNVVIEELRVNQVQVWPCGSANVAVAAEPLNSPVSGVTIPPGHQDLEFRYTAPDFRNGEAIRFQYQLEGFEKEWHLVDGERWARYRSVPPGDYVFRVKVAHLDNRSNGTNANLGLHLLPHFYQTTWFQLSSVFGTGLILSLMGWLVANRRMHRRMEILESHRKVEQERARIAHDMHDELGSKLTRISYISELAMQMKTLPESTIPQLKAIAHTARELLRSMDEIVWAVNPRNDDVEHLATYLGQHASDYFENTSVACTVEIPSELPDTKVSSEARHHLFLSFKESLTNVLKHSGANQISIQMQITEIEFQIKVSDDGKGIADTDANEEDVFSENSDGFRNMRLRLSAIGGVCKVESAPGRGTDIYLSIPV